MSLLPPGASLSALLLLPSGATASPPRPRPPNRIPRHQSRVGEIAGLGDLRPGCVAFGQTRNYSLTTSGAGDANLFVEVTEGNISSMRARCEGCEWVGWTVGCVPDAKPGSCCDHYSQYYNCGGSGDDNGGTAQLSRAALGMSPCTMRNGTTWQVQVSLADATTATLDGLTPTEFTLRAELQNATMYDGREVRSRSDGGSGYVCCGAVRSFLMPEVPETHALAIQLNLTRGVVRAAFLKHGSCVAPLADIEDDHCTASSCVMTWLTVYDEFYGFMVHEYDAYLAIAFGPSPWVYNPLTTERRGGDWYISIASLPGFEAEFDLITRLLVPPRAPEYFSCNRFRGYCPKDYYHHGLNKFVDYVPSPPPALIEVASAAQPRIQANAASSGLAFGLCAAFVAARRVAALGRGSRLRLHRD